MNRIRLLALVCFLVVVPAGIFSQEENNGAANAEGGNGLPRQFREIALGMSLDDLRDALQRDPMFDFRGERDVSFIPIREESLVETTGSSFVRRAHFQLRDGGLFIMSLTLNTGLMDYHSMFTHFLRRYGEPTYLNPREAVWIDGATRVSLERPLTVRYIDVAVFNEIVGDSMLIESSRVREFQEFLDEF